MRIDTGKKTAELQKVDETVWALEGKEIQQICTFSNGKTKLAVIYLQHPRYFKKAGVPELRVDLIGPEAGRQRTLIEMTPYCGVYPSPNHELVALRCLTGDPNKKEEERALDQIMVVNQKGDVVVEINANKCQVFHHQHRRHSSAELVLPLSHHSRTRHNPGFGIIESVAPDRIVTFTLSRDDRADAICLSTEWRPRWSLSHHYRSPITKRFCPPAFFSESGSHRSGQLTITPCEKSRDFGLGMGNYNEGFARFYKFFRMNPAQLMGDMNN